MGYMGTFSRIQKALCENRINLPRRLQVHRGVRGQATPMSTMLFRGAQLRDAKRQSERRDIVRQCLTVMESWPQSVTMSQHKPKHLFTKWCRKQVLRCLHCSRCQFLAFRTIYVLFEGSCVLSHVFCRMIPPISQQPFAARRLGVVMRCTNIQ